MEFSSDYLSTGVCVVSRQIVLGDIAEGTGQRFAAQLHTLLLADDKAPVTVMMTSCGGEWHNAMVIYDLVRFSPVPMNLVVMGSCMSAAVIIAQAFTKRILFPNTTVMAHDGTYDRGPDGIRNIEAWNKWLKAGRKQMYDILASRSPKKASWWAAKCKGADYIMTASQAVALGLFDEVYNERRVHD